MYWYLAVCRLPGVEVRDFSRGDGTGFVVCFIPESETKPHRAEMLDNKPYKIRIADAFINPSPSLLRSLFFPRSSPLLEISVSADWPTEGPEPAPTVDARFDITLRNIGVVTAKDVFIVISTVPFGLKARAARTDVIITETDSGIGVEYTRPLHPSSNVMICTIRRPMNTSYRNQGAGVEFVPRMAPFEATFDVYAGDMIPLRLGVAYGDRDVKERTRKTAVLRTTE